MNVSEKGLEENLKMKTEKHCVVVMDLEDFLELVKKTGEGGINEKCLASAQKSTAN